MSQWNEHTDLEVGWRRRWRHARMFVDLVVDTQPDAAHTNTTNSASNVAASSPPVPPSIDPATAVDVCVLSLACGFDADRGVMLYANGVTPHGCSATLVLDGFTPYFYIERRSWWTDADCTALCAALGAELERLERVRITDDCKRRRVDETDADEPEDRRAAFDALDSDDGDDDPDVSAAAAVSEHDERRARMRVKMRRHGKRRREAQRTVRGRHGRAEWTWLCRQRGRWVSHWERVTDAVSFVGYRGADHRLDLMRVYVASPRLIGGGVTQTATCRAVLEGVVASSSTGLAWLPRDFPLAPPRGVTAPTHTFTMYEANIDYTCRFLADRQLRPSAWWRVAACTHTTTRVDDYVAGNAAPLAFTTDYTVRCHHTAVAMVDDTVVGPRAGTALCDTTPNALVCSFDIECAGSDGHFPQADHDDPVVMVAVVFYRLWTPERRRRYVLLLAPTRESAELDRTHFSADITLTLHRTERELLEHFREMVVGVDPDVLTGYNMGSFDLRYMRDRAQRLDIGWVWANGLGRSPPPSDAAGALDTLGGLVVQRPRSVRGITKQTVTVGGRFVLDMLQWALAPGPGKQFNDLRLGGVAHTVLGDTKIDVPPDRIAPLYRQRRGRSILIKYVDKDAVLPARIDAARQVIREYLEQSQQCCVPAQHVHDRGSDHSVMSALSFFMNPGGRVDAAARHGRVYYVQPTKRYEDESAPETKQYKGGDVKAPRVGFYGDDPVLTLDFASLYPSIMRELNLCPTTRVDDETVLVRERLVEDVDYTRQRRHVVDAATGDMQFDPDTKRPRTTHDPNGACFLTRARQCGVVPQFLEYLAAKRKHYKRLLAEAKRECDTHATRLDDAATAEAVAVAADADAAVVNGHACVATAERRHLGAAQERRNTYSIREQKVKLLMNSSYGVFAAATSRLPCMELAKRVTFRGRELIIWMGWLAERLFTRAAGYPCDARVVYGDTDSIMVWLPACTLDDAKRVGPRMSAELNTYLAWPHNLEYEKTYMHYILIAKKMYAGLKYEAGVEHPTLECKGISAVRRGTMQFERDLVNRVLQLIVVEGRLEDAVEYAQRRLRALQCGEVPVHHLRISASLREDPFEYKTHNRNGAKMALMPHVALAQRMARATPSNPPRCGDRIAYVMCHTEAMSRTARGKALTERNRAARDKAVAPMDVLKHSMPVDYTFYVERVRTSLLNVFRGPLGSEDVAVRRLFTGAHMRVRVAPRMRTNSPLASFLRSAAPPPPRCDRCSVPLERRGVVGGVDSPLCAECSPQRDEVVARRRADVDVARRQRDASWRQCYECVGGAPTSTTSTAEIEECASECCDNHWTRLWAERQLREATVRLRRWDGDGEHAVNALRTP